MFTLDYALWFDQVLPGLERLDVPIPLGGTSNHFSIDVLRELHAWDPFNVTEDADLGIRIGPRKAIGSASSIPPPSRRRAATPGNGSAAFALDQGLHADLLVHTRRPLHLMRTAGPLGFLGFIFFIGGTVLAGAAQSDLLGAVR